MPGSAPPERLDPQHRDTTEIGARIEIRDLPVGVFRASAEATIEAANPALAGLLGYTAPDHLLGRSIEALFADPNAYPSWISQLERLGSIRGQPVGLTRAEGSPLHVELTARLILPSDATEPKIVGVASPLARTGPEADAGTEPPLTGFEPGGFTWVDVADPREWARFAILGADAAHLGLAINVVDDEGATLAYINQAGAEILGQAPADLIGGPPRPWASMKDRLEASETIEHGAGQTARFTGTMERPDGSQRVIEAGIGPGRYDGWPATFVFFQDVTPQATQREKLRRAEARHRAIVEAADRADLGLCILRRGEEGTHEVLYANETCARIAGVALERVVGGDPASISNEEGATALTAAETGEGPSRFWATARRPDGTEVPVEVGIATGTYQGEPATFAFVRDVTQQRAVEDRLEKLNERLEASNEDLERFAYAVSHDLREPLRMVRGFVDLIDRRHADEIPPDALDLFAYVRDGAERMESMIEAVLAFARVETRGQQPEPTESTEALEAALDALESRLLEAGVEVSHDQLPTVLADPDQLARLFQNLIANALDHGSPSLSHVHVGAEAQDEAWRLTVDDDGQGIPGEDRDQIFEVFQRGSAAGEDAEGVGLGLALCKRIVERHGGTIGAGDAPTGGARFWFTLPAPGQPPPDHAPAMPDPDQPDPASA